VGEIAGDEVGDGDERVRGAVAPGASLGGLDEGVDALGAAVGEARVERGEHAVPMLFEGGGRRLRRAQLYQRPRALSACSRVLAVE
jgi:hypothetical protein